MRVWRLGLAMLLPLLPACTAAFITSSTNTADLNAVNFSTLGSMKRGEDCSTTYLGLFTEGEAMVTNAARDAGVNQVKVVENKLTSNLLFSRHCVIVFGQ